MTMTLTYAEQLFLFRRRLGLTQAQAAKRANMSTSEYVDWERGKRSSPANRLVLHPPAPHELVTLLRRRSGMTQQQLAKKLGLCRYWVRCMELGTANPKPLLDYWVQQ